MKVSEIIKRPPKILIYSGPGTGKTALTLTLGKRLQIIDLDDGLQCAFGLEDEFQKARLSVDVKQFLEPSPHTKATAYKRTKEYLIGVANDCIKGQYPFPCLALDSITRLADYALNYIMYNSGCIHQQPQIQHWGLAIGEVRQIIALLQSLPLVVIVIGHEQIKTIGKGPAAEDKIFLGLYGTNLPLQIPGYFDEMWRIRVKQIGSGKQQFLLETQATAIADAKSRACLPTRTDLKVGMWEILKLIGYEPKEVKE